MYNYIGPSVDTYPCNKQASQNWIWNTSDSSIRSKHTGQCLTVRPELEIWTGLLNDSSQAVLLFNRGDNNNEQITVQWNQIGFLPNSPALVRNLWTQTDVGVFTGNYTSSNIDSHGVVMLKITPMKKNSQRDN